MFFFFWIHLAVSDYNNRRSEKKKKAYLTLTSSYSVTRAKDQGKQGFIITNHSLAHFPYGTFNLFSSPPFLLPPNRQKELIRVFLALKFSATQKSNKTYISDQSHIIPLIKSKIFLSQQNSTFLLKVSILQPIHLDIRIFLL